jgi:TRAP-type uncharacterized transport system fused permease subunit
MSFLKKLKNSKHFSVLSKKKDSISSLVQDLDHRHIIVYHIDSETEGNFSLTVRVSIHFFCLFVFFCSISSLRIL